jgi:tetratricopeptide (TPR) repeat protein
MTPDEIRIDVAEAMKLKLIGNEQLKQSNVSGARTTYVEALKLVFSAVEKLKTMIQGNEDLLRTNLPLAHDLDSVKGDIEDIRIQLISNLSLTELKLELYEEAATHASMVLVADPLNPKALFRRSVARIRLEQQLEEALADLQKVAERDPGNPEVRDEISKCREAIKKRKPDTFTQNIRGSLKEEKQNPSFFNSLMSMSWLGEMSAVFAQCGGLRPRPAKSVRRSPNGEKKVQIEKRI